MIDILTRAGCFVFIIILGYTLRRIGVFKESDFKVLSTVVLKITLPAAIISSSAGKAIDPSMLTISLMGLGGGIIYMSIGYMMHRRRGKTWQAFGVVNTGYNIGNFTLPFVQSFLGPMGVITTSLFDTGNACICLGGSFGIGSSVVGTGKFSFKAIGKALMKSVPFICYVLMLILNLAHLTPPQPVLTLAGTIGNANAFVAMLMIGVGFKLGGDRSQIGFIVKFLGIRYGIAAVLACLVYFALPMALEVRQAIVILLFSPIASAAPAYTERLGGDFGLASALNSITIICSIVIIVTLLMVML